MIFDNIKNCERYENVNSNFKKAFQFLKREDLKTLPLGRYEICGDDVFANIQEYEPKDLEAGSYEAHKRYADIQYMIEGEEIIGFSPIDKLSIKMPYDEEKDAMFLNGEKMLYRLRNEEFFVFFPQEPHMPGITDSQGCKVKKVVIKIKCPFNEK